MTSEEPGQIFHADGYLDLGSAFDWLKHIILTGRPHLGGDTSSLWNSAVISQTHFAGEPMVA